MRKYRVLVQSTTNNLLEKPTVKFTSACVKTIEIDYGSYCTNSIITGSSTNLYILDISQHTLVANGQQC